MKIKAAFHWLVFAACIAGWITELTQSPSTLLSTILGIVGAIYCLFYVVGLFLFPVKRDWVMMKGNFLLKVVNFVLLVPFVLTLLLAGSQSSDILQLEESSGNGGCCHMAECGAQEEQDYSLFWSVYSHYIDPGNQHMAGTEKGRQYVALITILGYILLNGVLISTLVSWFDRRREQWIKGEIVYNRFNRRWLCGKKHYVIIGGSDVAIGLVGQLFNNSKGGKPYIIVQTSSEIDTFRRELFSTLTEKQQRRLVLYYGSSTSKDDLAKLGLNNAAEVYLLGENTRPDDTDSYHDTVNMECLTLLQELYMQTPNGKSITAKIDKVAKLKEQLTNNTKTADELWNDANNVELEQWWKSRPRLKCRVMFEYQTTFSVFQFFDINEDMTAYIDFKPFNYYEMWAQNVLINREVDKSELEQKFAKLGYLPLEGAEGIKSGDSDYVHLFVVGMSRMGVAMAIEAAHLAHYPNYTEENKTRTKITFIDANAAEDKDFFMGRFKELFKLSHWRYGVVEEGELVWKKTSWPEPEECDYLGGDFLDVEWEFIASGVEQGAVQDYILSSANPQARVTIAICLPESNKAHAAALYLDKKLYASDRVMQVLVYNRNGGSIIDAISRGNVLYPYRGKLRSFGCTCECQVVEHLNICEYVGKQIDLAYNGGVEDKSITKSKYEGKSKEAMRWSSIYNGNTTWTKLRSVGFDSQNTTLSEKDVQLLADVEHNRWNIEQLLMHFRPLTREEQESEIANNNANKKQLKNQMVHTDICSNKRLLEIDGDARKYDVDLTNTLGDIYREVKSKEETIKTKQ